ncbi:MAG: hypothetical protein ABIG73_00635 [Patescibacteria group bacterium]
MKYLVFIIPILFLALVLNSAYSMTTIIYFNDIQKIIDINNMSYFSITKTEGAYLSIDPNVIPSIGTENIILSLFLRKRENAKDISEFLIYPVGRISKEAEAIGLIVSTKTKENDHVDISLPKNFFDKVKNPSGLFIRTTQNSTFLFQGIDSAGVVGDPSLTIVGEEFENKNIEEKQTVLTPSDYAVNIKILENIEKTAKNSEKILENTKKKFYENPFITFILGIFASLVAATIYKFFPK